MRFRKRPAEVDAVQWKGDNLAEIAAFVGRTEAELDRGAGGQITILTLEGPVRATRRSWVVKGTEGEFWPVREDIFPRIYEHIRTYPHERPAGGLRDDDVDANQT